MVNQKNLKKFLVKAKINTYALSGEGGENVLADGSKEFLFEENIIAYRDRYFGSVSFIGEEIVFQNKKPMWGMNYYGEIISENISKNKVYEFLKNALLKVKENKPFRGPDNFEEDNFKYINKAEGNVEKFYGQEIILYKKQLVYKLFYHGGLIKKSTN